MLVCIYNLLILYFVGSTVQGTPIKSLVHEIEVGKSKVISCHPDGKPSYKSDPGLQWFFNDMELLYNEDPVSDEAEEEINKGVKVIDRFTLNISVEDTYRNGTYSCKILSPRYRRLVHHHILAFKPLKMKETFPQDLYTAKLKTPIRMQCSVDGWPSPKVSWTRVDGKDLPHNMGKVSKKDYLNFYARETDGGRYLCSAKNQFNSISKLVELVVQYRPTLTQNVLGPDGDQATIFTRMGVTASLSCTALGGPAPNISWDFQPEFVEDGGSILGYGPNRKGYDKHFENIANPYSTRESRIDITSVSKRSLGTYTCTATNEFGSAAVAMEFTARPGPMEMASYITYTESDGYYVKCNYSDGCVIRWQFKKRVQSLVDGYSIEIKKHSHNETRSMIIDSKLLPFVLEKLDPNSRYQITVTAMNSFGRSETLRILADTRPEGSPKLPADIRKNLRPNPVIQDLDNSQSTQKQRSAGNEYDNVTGGASSIFRWTFFTSLSMTFVAIML